MIWAGWGEIRMCGDVGQGGCGRPGAGAGGWRDIWMGHTISADSVLAWEIGSRAVGSD